MAAIGEYGYDQAALNAEQTNVAAAEELNNAQIREHGEQLGFTEELNKIFDAAKKEYMRLVKIARRALKNDPVAYNNLGLLGSRRRSLSGFLTQAEKFYTNAMTDTVAQEQLNKFLITGEKLTAGQQLITQVKTAAAKQAKETGESEQAALSRDQALDAIDSWFSDFTAVARIALEEKPQLLEKLSIMERS